MSTSSLLEVEDISVEFPSRRGFGRRARPLTAVRNVSFEVRRGATFGLVGESGSGKTTVGRAILRLVEPVSGQIRLDGVDGASLVAQDELAFRRRVQAVLQDPYSSLNRSHQVGGIIGEVLALHHGCRGAELARRVEELLETVGLGQHLSSSRPRQLSGGRRQRVAIARALAAGPDLIVCDEPTSALDVSVQSQVINVFEELQESTGVAYVFIAHDLGVVRHISDEIGVMYLGSMVERGDADGVYRLPAHPYSAMLLAAAPVADPSRQRERALLRRSVQLTGDPPSPMDLPPGCPFASRCPAAMDICRVERPPAVEAHHGGTASCHLHGDGPRLGGGPVGEFLLSLRASRPIESATA